MYFELRVATRPAIFAFLAEHDVRRGSQREDADEPHPLAPSWLSTARIYRSKAIAAADPYNLRDKRNRRQSLQTSNSEVPCCAIVSGVTDLWRPIGSMPSGLNGIASVISAK